MNRVTKRVLLAGAVLIGLLVLVGKVAFDVTAIRLITAPRAPREPSPEMQRIIEALQGNEQIIGKDGSISVDTRENDFRATYYPEKKKVTLFRKSKDTLTKVADFPVSSKETIDNLGLENMDPRRDALMIYFNGNNRALYSILVTGKGQFVQKFPGYAALSDRKIIRSLYTAISGLPMYSDNRKFCAQITKKGTISVSEAGITLSEVVFPARASEILNVVDLADNKTVPADTKARVIVTAYCNDKKSYGAGIGNKGYTTKVVEAKEDGSLELDLE